MTKVKLVGVNALGETVKLGKEVHHFGDAKNCFGVYIIDASTVKLCTAKGSYLLKKHATLNIYMGILNNRKTHVILKQVVGELIYW